MRHASVLVACALLAALTSVANAQSCDTEIERLTAAASSSGATASLTAPQSVAAQLSRQPTPASIARAKGEAQSRFAAMIEKARGQNARGDTPGCLSTVARARQLLELD